jgi:hypothetical protein
MKLRLIGALLLVAMLAPDMADAADRALRAAPDRGHHASHWLYRMPPYPVSRRAAQVRAADRCWRGCQAHGGRHFQACLRARSVTECVALNGVADRFCLHECRIGAGPWVILTE